MSPTEQNCGTERIDDYLDEQLTPQQRAEFETHLSNCSSCQVELESRAADPDIWREAVQLLAEDSSQLDHSDAQQRTQRLHRVLEMLAPTDDPEMLGRIGDYEVSGVVGHGGMGAVLKGFDRSLRRVVAIKVMAPHLADSGSARQRFQREARAAAAITHDNVIATYGVAEANGLPYLVMPFARGPSLQKRLDESGPLAAVEVVRIGRQIASGLAAAHEQGLVHRDIKPANILLNEGIERLWITDFGVARAVDDASMTQTGVIAGTPQYMSPEQARGESVSPASDLFSLGSVLYTACTGRPPFRAEAAWGILRRITDTEPRPIQELNPEIPAWLCELIERLMAKDVAHRFPSAAEVAEILEHYLAHLQQPAVVEAPESPGRWRPSAVVPRPSAPLPHEQRAAARPAPAAPSRWALSGSAVRTGLFAAAGLVLLAVMAWQATSPPNIAGSWTGEIWPRITLSTVRNADGWYTGVFQDEGGQEGAVQLEWSRLQRRYVGRWKVGQGAGGSLTLRADDGRIRGAIAVDADSPTPDDVARLRDFLWVSGEGPITSTMPRELSAMAPSPAETPLDGTVGRRLTIESPIQGRLIRWSDRIRDGALVKAGDLIAEVQPDDRNRRDRLQAQQQHAEDLVTANKSRIVALQESVAARVSELASRQVKLETAQEASRQLEKSHTQLMAAAEKRTASDQAAVDEVAAVLLNLETELQRQQKLFDKAVIPQSSLQLSERRVAEQKARLAEAKSTAAAAEVELITIKRDAQFRQQQDAAAVEDRVDSLNATKGALAAAEAELAVARGDLAKSQKTLLEFQSRLARQETYLVVAPEDGQIEQLFDGQMLKAGDVICVLRPERGSSIDDQATRVHGADEERDDVPRFRAREIASLPGQPASAVSVSDAVEAAWSLERRFRKFLPKAGFRDQDLVGASREQAAAWQDRQTALSLLTGQLNAVRKRLDSQITMRDRVSAQINMGVQPAAALLYSEVDVTTTAVELEQLQMLVDYYTALAGDGERRANQEFAVAMMQSCHEAARKRHALYSQLRKMAAQRFDVGDVDVNVVAEAEQAEATAAAQLEMAAALMDHYSEGATVQEEAAKPQADERSADEPSAATDDASGEPSSDDALGDESRNDSRDDAANAGGLLPAAPRGDVLRPDAESDKLQVDVLSPDLPLPADRQPGDPDAF